MATKDLNKVFLCGRLTHNAEVKTTNDGNSGCLFSLAVDRTKELTDFFDIEMWNKNASTLSPYLLKGKQVIVEGNLKLRTWEKDGQKRQRVVVWADNVQLLGGVEKTHSDAGNAPATKPKTAPNGPESWDDDDIPF